MGAGAGAGAGDKLEEGAEDGDLDEDRDRVSPLAPSGAAHERFVSCLLWLAPAMQPGNDYADEFEYGLGVVLDGLERALTGA